VQKAVNEGVKVKPMSEWVVFSAGETSAMVLSKLVATIPPLKGFQDSIKRIFNRLGFVWESF